MLKHRSNWLLTHFTCNILDEIISISVAKITLDFMTKWKLVNIYDHTIEILIEEQVIFILEHLYNLANEKHKNQKFYRKKFLNLNKDIFISLVNILQMNLLTLKLVFSSTTSEIESWLPYVLIEKTSLKRYIMQKRYVFLLIVDRMIKSKEVSSQSLYNIITILKEDLWSVVRVVNINFKAKGMLLLILFQVIYLILNVCMETATAEENNIASQMKYLQLFHKELIEFSDILLKNLNSSTYIKWHELLVKDPQGLNTEYSLQNYISHLSYKIIEIADDEIYSNTFLKQKLQNLAYKRPEIYEEIKELKTDALLNLLRDNEFKNSQNVNHVVQELLQRHELYSQNNLDFILEIYKSVLSCSTLVLVIQSTDKLEVPSSALKSLNAFFVYVLNNGERKELLEMIKLLDQYFITGYNNINIKANMQEVLASCSKNFTDILKEILKNPPELFKFVNKFLKGKFKGERHKRSTVTKLLYVFKYLLPIKYKLQKLLYISTFNLLDSIDFTHRNILNITSFFATGLSCMNFFDKETIFKEFVLYHLLSDKINKEWFLAFFILARFIKLNILKSDTSPEIVIFLFAYYRLKNFSLFNKSCWFEMFMFQKIVATVIRKINQSKHSGTYFQNRRFSFFYLFHKKK